MNTIMIAAMRSGSGKTVLTYGLLYALQEKGYRVSSFKTGPDYIDPMYHYRITKRSCINLDPYFLEPEIYPGELKKLFYRHAGDTDIAVIEGCMGYYDGIVGQNSRGSASAVAKELDASVILLVDQPTIQDFFMDELMDYLQKDHHIRYLFLNRINEREKNEFSEAFYGKIRGTGLSHIRILGYLERSEDLELKSRHLGLIIPRSEEEILRSAKRVAQELSKHSEIFAELIGNINFSSTEKSIGMKKSILSEEVLGQHLPKEKKSALTLAIAKDEAFCFLYPDNVDLLIEFGFQPVYFSPLRDKSLPEGICGIYLTGGYPEVYAKELAENVDMKDNIAQAVKDGIPLIAECGGFLYLHRHLEGMDGKQYPMCNVIEADAFRTDKLQRFGYIELHAKSDGLLLKQGEKTRAHEFHYWDSENNGESVLAVKANQSKAWDCIHASENLHAGFAHLYFRSEPKMLENLVHACRAYLLKKKLKQRLSDIRPVPTFVFEHIQKNWDSIAKPLRGLGELEKLICKIGAIQNMEAESRSVPNEPNIRDKAILVMCADNGIVSEGVSQTDSSVTAVVSGNIARGLASVNKMAEGIHARVIAVDVGIQTDVDMIGLKRKKTAYGTKNFLYADAMSMEEMLHAINIGIEEVRELKEQGIALIGTGEMGIGNTTTAAAVSSVLLGITPSKMVGRGAGLDDLGLKRKLAVIEEGIRKRKPDAGDALDVLRKLGGLDLAALTGVFIGGGIYGVPIVIDGFISSTAALIARRCCERLTEYMLASHQSAEPAAAYVMQELGLSPIIHAGMKLGEGTGCVCLFGLLDMAMAVYQDRVTFADIEVEQYICF